MSPPDASTAALPWTRPALVAAVLLCLALRLVGSEHGRPPLLPHADERHYAGVAARLTWDQLQPDRFENPPLLTYALFAGRELVALVAGAEDGRAWVRQGGLVLLARWLAALTGALTALIVGASARRLWGPTAGWVALAVVGSSFLHGRDSHFGVNDVPMTALVAVTTHGAVVVLTGGGARWALLAALAAGLAAATKYNGAVAAALAPLAWLLRPAPPDAPAPGAGARLAGAGGLGLVALLGFVLGNPWVVLDPQAVRAGFENQLSGWGDAPMWGQSREPLAWLYGRATLALTGELPALLALLGLAWLVRREPRRALIVLALPVLYLAGMATKQLFFWRFVLPLLPALALLAAAGGAVLARALAPRLARPGPLLAALLLVVCLPGLVRLVRLDQLLLREPTWLQARRWALAELPRDTRLFAEGYPPRFPPGWTVIEPGLHIDKLHEVREPGRGGQEVLSIQQGGVLLTDDWYRRGWAREPQAAEREAFYRRLEASFEELAVFAPGPDGNPEPYELDSLYAPLVDLWGVERPGHTVRAWRIPPHTWAQSMLDRPGR